MLHGDIYLGSSGVIGAVYAIYFYKTKHLLQLFLHKMGSNDRPKSTGVSYAVAGNCPQGIYWHLLCISTVAMSENIPHDLRSITVKYKL